MRPSEEQMADILTQVQLITLMLPPFYSCLPISQHAQCQSPGTGTPKWNVATLLVVTPGFDKWTCLL